MLDIITKSLILVASMCIVSYFVGMWREKANAYTDSTQKFDIHLSRGVTVVFIIWTMFCLLCAAGATFISDSITTETHEENLKYAIAFIILGAPGLILIPISKKKISICGNSIRVKSVFSSRNYTFDDISHYYGEDIITIYSGTKPLFSFGFDRIGAKNMIARLKEEQISKAEKSHTQNINNRALNRTIRKKDVLSPRKNSSVITLCTLFLVVGIVGLFVNIAFGLIIIALIIPVVLFIYLTGPLKYYMIMSNMEKALRINIDEEMARLGISDFHEDNDIWFFSSSDPYRLILHRDYIKEILELSKGSAGWYDLIFTAIDGKKVKIKIMGAGSFAGWFGLSREDCEILSEPYWFKNARQKEPADRIPDRQKD